MTKIVGTIDVVVSAGHGEDDCLAAIFRSRPFAAASTFGYPSLFSADHLNML